jgi:hypothetical protein
MPVPINSDEEDEVISLLEQPLIPLAASPRPLSDEIHAAPAAARPDVCFVSYPARTNLL